MLKTEIEIRNEYAKNPTSGTHIATNNWFYKTMVREKYKFQSAIDFGCNTGYGFGMYGLRFTEGNITLVDFAATCLDGAKKRFGPNVQYIELDLTLPWPVFAKYELVCLCQVIQHIPNIRVAENIFEQACLLCTKKMLFSHYGTKKGDMVEGYFEHGLFYRRCSYDRLSEIIRANNMKTLFFKDVKGDYNFILEPR